MRPANGDRPHIVFALTGDVTRNSRALRQLDCFRELGCRLTVFGFDQAYDDGFGEPDWTWFVLERPKRSGAPFFHAVHRRLVREVSALDADIFHASDLYVLPALARRARQTNARLVFDSRELYTHVAATSGRPWVRLFWHLVQHRYFQQVDLMFTVSPSIALHLRHAYKIELPTVVLNVPSKPAVTPSSHIQETAELPPGSVIVLHQGKIQRDRGCDVLLDAFQSVRGAHLVFLGDGPLRTDLEKRAAALSCSKTVHFLDPVAPTNLLGVTAAADLGITLLQDTCLNHRYALPNKLFEYLTVGVPVIGSALPEVSRVIETLDVGQTTPPADPRRLAEVLQSAIDRPKLRQKWKGNTRLLGETFSARKASQLFKDSYSSLLATRI